MLVTDNAYPRFYGLDDRSVYVFLFPGDVPRYVVLHPSGDPCAARSRLHATEDQVAQIWSRDYPSAEIVRQCLQLIAGDSNASN